MCVVPGFWCHCLVTGQAGQSMGQGEMSFSQPVEIKKLLYLTMLSFINRKGKIIVCSLWCNEPPAHGYFFTHTVYTWYYGPAVFFAALFILLTRVDSHVNSDYLEKSFPSSLFNRT